MEDVIFTAYQKMFTEDAATAATPAVTSSPKQKYSISVTYPMPTVVGAGGVPQSGSDTLYITLPVGVNPSGVKLGPLVKST